MDTISLLYQLKIIKVCVCHALSLLEGNIVVGGPSKSSSTLPPTPPTYSTDQGESAIAAQLDKIASLLEKLLGVSAEILNRLKEQAERGGEAKVRIEEPEIGEYLPKGVDVSTLLDLPDHLRKPLMALFKLGGRGTAAQVSERIGVSRPQVSATLNTLVRLGLLVKKREGKEGRRGADAIFLVPEGKQ
jgi:uncharacterized membrane protein